jgi:hypothetical protein
MVVLAGSGVAGAAVTGASAATAHVASSLPPCIPKIKSAKGHSEVLYCGPATATLKIGGKTYDFKNGYCTKSAAEPLSLTLGAIVVGVKNNNGLPQFSLSVDHSSIKIDTVSADYGGKQLATADFVTLKGPSSLTSGTFASTKSVFGGSKPFTGSWNCHGGLSSS